MLRHDPRSSYAMKTPVGASKPLGFANTTRIDVFHSIAQQVFCLIIREGLRDPTTISRQNMLRHDPLSSHAMTTPILASKPLGFANTTRTNVFHSLAQQVFCIVIRQDPTAICRPEYVKTYPHSSDAVMTPIGVSKPLWFANTMRTDNILRHDPRSSHAMTTPIGASKPLRFANTLRADVFHSLAQQVFCLAIREDF
ncbi:uncharacterized protein G2W53_026434 [Senna tora]|uniref:Uncharacterized protein n=1 Tax=Senna tora TaxID=362788 RepID=A0A834TNZ8_9FABA|nr:uncharacterized protein G2W53_026434 [Senna tora]